MCGFRVELGRRVGQHTCVCYEKANAVGEFQGTAAGDEEHMWPHSQIGGTKFISDVLI